MIDLLHISIIWTRTYGLFQSQTQVRTHRTGNFDPSAVTAMALCLFTRAHRGPQEAMKIILTSRGNACAL